MDLVMGNPTAAFALLSAVGGAHARLADPLCTRMP